MVFSDVKEYTSLESWAADSGKHLVPANSPYAFQPKAGSAFGWVVGATERLAQPLTVPQMKRMLRSIYKVSQA